MPSPAYKRLRPVDPGHLRRPEPGTRAAAGSPPGTAQQVPPRLYTPAGGGGRSPGRCLLVSGVDGRLNRYARLASGRRGLTPPAPLRRPSAFMHTAAVATAAGAPRPSRGARQPPTTPPCRPRAAACARRLAASAAPRRSPARSPVVCGLPRGGSPLPHSARAVIPYASSGAASCGPRPRGGSPQSRLLPALPPPHGRRAGRARPAWGRLRRPWGLGLSVRLHRIVRRRSGRGEDSPPTPPVPRPRWGPGEAEAYPAAITTETALDRHASLCYTVLGGLSKDWRRVHDRRIMGPSFFAERFQAIELFTPLNEQEEIRKPPRPSRSSHFAHAVYCKS